MKGLSESSIACNFAACSRLHDLVIVMDKPPLESDPREGNTESYSRSLHHLLTLEKFRRENFRKVSIVTKITKFFY